MSNSPDYSKDRGAPVTSLALERIVRSPAALIDHLPIAICTSDREGVLIQHNCRAAELWGRAPAPGESLSHFFGTFKTFDRDGGECDPDQSPMALVLRTGQPVRDHELTIEKPGGERLALLVNVDPVQDEQGSMVGAIACFQDITELSDMRRQVSENRRLGREVMEALPTAIYTTDADGKLLYFNKAAEQMWGRTPKLGEQHWCGAWKLYLADGTLLPHEHCPMAVAIRERRAMIGPEAIAERPDGSRIPFLPHPTPIFDSSGKMIGAVNMLLDLSGQKHADARQRGLIDELNHRVKNTLATIQSLATQTMRGSHDQGAKDFEARLLTLSRVHDQLSRHSWEWADFTTIVQQTFAPLRGSANCNVAFDGPSVHLSPKRALALAMVLRELAANAEKHGALSTPAGALALTWHLDHGKLLLDWREQGGPTVCPPRKRGFGTRLFERSIGAELGGVAHIDYLPAGVHCTMEIPLPE